MGTLPGRANAIVSAGTPIAATIAAPTAACSGEPSGGMAPRVSATTTSRSVPVRGSWTPNAATQPRLIPGTSATASSTSCG